MHFEVALQDLAILVEKSTSGLFFTGAGVSTESGIPDFRGPQGVWKKWQPVYFDEFLRSDEARKCYWEYKLSGWDGFRHARPNAAHKALAELDRLGHVGCLVTQNIDGLHHLAGHPEDRIIEIHGTNRLIECVVCGMTSEPEPAFQAFSASRQPPLCDCGGYLKPATISFGQRMPADKLQRAFGAAAQADLVISIGSTLEVEPAASIPLAAKKGGATYAIINRGETAHDHLADIRLEGDAGEILSRLLTEMKSGSA